MSGRQYSPASLSALLLSVSHDILRCFRNDMENRGVRFEKSGQQIIFIILSPPKIVIRRHLFLSS